MRAEEMLHGAPHDWMEAVEAQALGAVPIAAVQYTAGSTYNEVPAKLAHTFDSHTLRR